VLARPLSHLSPDLLVSLGVARERAPALAAAAGAALGAPTPEERWRRLVGEVLEPRLPHEVHVELHRRAFAGWDASRGPVPAWLPDPTEVAGCNAAALAREVGLDGPLALHAWSAAHREEFWERVIARLGIVFQERPVAVADLDAGPARARWLPGARMNIVESCLAGDPDRLAVCWRSEEMAEGRLSAGELLRLVSRVAHGLRAAGFGRGDAIAVDLPMTAEAVAIYLGIVAVGGVVVSIADSFAPQEIATRLRLAHACGIFTQDVVARGGRRLPLYAKVREAGAPRAIVLAAGGALEAELRPDDVGWERFLGSDLPFTAVPCAPGDYTNILFSSGTTGDPKAIPWTQTTPIKAAADGHLHHDIRPGDVVAWPTNLGWMMGPWLIYASLINRAAIALYNGTPSGAGFARFVQDAGVTMLGVVPSLVKSWRESGCLEGVDWRELRAFSSTGECSNPQDYFWLMGRAGYRPVIEYCGGTEIGGGYACGTVFQPSAPSTFTTPAFGLDFVILAEGGQPADLGELCLVPPSIGLSERLLNASHHEVYFEGMPRGPRGEVLRRHGDEFERLPGGYYRGHGRVDDTMNLGGIKVSSAEIERACNWVTGVRETAAIAVDPPGGGPSLLVIYLVRAPDPAPPSLVALRTAMQRAIREQLNPLFRIHDVIELESLPRTASNKVMRRLLRKRYRAD
jgi:acetyl-CoA synthetase